MLFLGQYKLWFTDEGIINSWNLVSKIANQATINENKKDINQSLYAEVLDLKKGYAVIEEIARRDLGLIKQDEHYYYIIE